MKLGNTLQKWEALSCKHKISNKKLANCSPYFTALQYLNNLETQRSYKTTVNLKNINFFKKNLSSGLNIIRLFVKVDQNVYKTDNKSASIHMKSFFLTIGWSYLHDLSHRFLKRLKLLWGEMAFQSRLVFYRWRPNIKIVQFLPITRLQISLKLWSMRF